MNANRFTALAHSLTAATTRRSVSRGLAGVTLGGVIASLTGGAEVGARKRKKHKKRPKDSPRLPPPQPDRCVAMLDGAACGNDGCLVCLDEVCSPNPRNDGRCGADGTGRCYDGSCNPRPTCTGTEDLCPAGDASCCSGRCGGGACYLAVAGALCKRGEDCVTGSCIGYRCR